MWYFFLRGCGTSDIQINNVPYINTRFPCTFFSWPVIYLLNIFSIVDSSQTFICFLICNYCYMQSMSYQVTGDPKLGPLGGPQSPSSRASLGSQGPWWVSVVGRDCSLTTLPFRSLEAVVDEDPRKHMFTGDTKQHWGWDACRNFWDLHQQGQQRPGPPCLHWGFVGGFFFFFFPQGYFSHFTGI